MKRLLFFAARLYPRSWRRRYGAEFDALLEDVNPTLSELFNVLGGALKMQLARGNLYWKLGAALAIAGAAVAAIVSFTAPRPYVSTSILRIVPAQPGAKIDPNARDWLNQMEQEILSRTSLSELIQRPSIDLYSSERERIPLEDVIQDMRSHIQVAAAPDRPLLSVSFVYPDKVKAQIVAQELARKFVEQSAILNRNHTRIWQSVWGASEPVTGGYEYQWVQLTDRPEQVAANRLEYIAAGLACGLALGLLAAALLRQPRRTLLLAAFAIAGCAAALAISAFLIPFDYTSTAVMRITQPFAVPQSVLQQINYPPPRQEIQRLAAKVLSRENLESIIQKPSLDLYHKDRAKMPLAQVADRMRNRAIRLQTAPDNDYFIIAVTYPDRYKAQSILRELAVGFTEQYAIAQRDMVLTTGSPAARTVYQHGIGRNVQILDAPSLPLLPTWPNQAAVAAIGLAVGLALGALFAIRRAPHHSPEAA